MNALGESNSDAAKQGWVNLGAVGTVYPYLPSP